MHMHGHTPSYHVVGRRVITRVIRTRIINIVRIRLLVVSV